MSDQHKLSQKEQKKQVPTNDQTKKNTDVWKQKQAAKKKEKQEIEGKGQPDTKEDKKEKKKDRKDKQKQQDKDKDKDKEKREEGIKSNSKGKTKTQQLPKKPSPAPTKQLPHYPQKPKKLQTIQSLIIPSYPRLLKNRAAQIQLIQKQIHNLIRPKDTILYLGKLQLHHTELVAGCSRNNYQLVEIDGYSHYGESEIVCRYEDLSYLMIEQIDKVFLEAVVIFQNGSALLPKGYQNIAILANHYNKPLVISSGSWNYCRISITSYDQLQHIFGQELLRKYDWVGNQGISLICMQFGAALPSQISYQVEQGYKKYGFVHAKW